MYGYQSIKREFERASRWHPQPVARVLVAVGIWLLVLTAMLYGSGHGGQWAWLLIPTAALHFGLAHCLSRIAKQESNRSVKSP